MENKTSVIRQPKANYFKTVFCTLLLGLSFLCVTNLNAQVINGQNANFVKYSGADEGAFEQQEGKKWIERKTRTGKLHATFTETGRDEWSIYLTKHDGLKLQLDLHTKEVKIHNRAYYKIVETKIVINGWSANYVKYTGASSGIFKRLSGKQWVEYKEGKTTPHATFTETGRDEWSVYLKKNDGASIQLDLHTKKVIVNRVSHFNIVETSITVPVKVNGQNVAKVVYTGKSSGTFKQLGLRQWVEYKEGKTTPHATFTETGRDEWSVYLRKNDGASIQLNLHTKKVIVNGTSHFNIVESTAR